MSFHWEFDDESIMFQWLFNYQWDFEMIDDASVVLQWETMIIQWFNVDSTKDVSMKFHDNQRHIHTRVPRPRSPHPQPPYRPQGGHIGISGHLNKSGHWTHIDIFRNAPTHFDMCRHISSFVDIPGHISTYVDVCQNVDRFQHMSTHLDKCQDMSDGRADGY